MYKKRLPKGAVAMSIKIKVSYTRDEEIKLVSERLNPITDSCKHVKETPKGGYKRTYFFKKDKNENS